MTHIHQPKQAYTNISLVIFGLFVSALIYNWEPFHEFLLHLDGFGYVGAFIAGVLFVSSFTVASGALILLVLAEQYPLIHIGLFAGVGALVGDVIIFRFVKNSLAEEIKALYTLVDHKHHVANLLHTRYFSWTLPVLGALIIASPLPDEIGVSLLGLSRMSGWKFALLSLVLNTLGIMIILAASSVIQP